MALGTANDRALAWLRAGEATSVVLLRATMSGLATCPLTDALEVGETRDAVQPEVFAGQASPQMLLRVGWAPVMPATAVDPAPPATGDRRVPGRISIRLNRAPIEGLVWRRLAGGHRLVRGHSTVQHFGWAVCRARRGCGR